MFRKRPDASAPTPAGESVYERVLGDRVADLHPRLRRYFGSIPEGFEGVGEGVYREAGLRNCLLRPVFALLARGRIAFPEYGRGVRFTIRNAPGPGGVRHAVRSFAFPSATREMTDSMRVVDGRLIDRVGSRGRVEVELDLLVCDGRMQMRSRRIALRVAGLRLPLPPLVKLVIEERASSTDPGAQHVDVRMIAPVLGEIYGYRGTFTYDLRPA